MKTPITRPATTIASTNEMDRELTARAKCCTRDEWLGSKHARVTKKISCSRVVRAIEHNITSRHKSFAVLRANSNTVSLNCDSWIQSMDRCTQ